MNSSQSGAVTQLYSPYDPTSSSTHSCPSFRKASTVSSTARLHAGEALTKQSIVKKKNPQSRIRLGEVSNVTRSVVPKFEFRWQLDITEGQRYCFPIDTLLPKGNLAREFYVTDGPVAVINNRIRE